MLGKGRAVELMDAIGTQVRKLIEPGAPAPDAIRLERVADAIVSIEYYMETLQNGRTDPWYMLDNAEMCIKALAEEAPSRVPNSASRAATPPRRVKLDPRPPLPGAASARMQQHQSAMIAVPEPEAVDPQFVELFIEEAKEEIASIQKSFPLWDQNPMDMESLARLCAAAFIR
jgi:chemosensory pili system protein ChpA (sensor histidine kinase/response regulator)